MTKPAFCRSTSDPSLPGGVFINTNKKELHRRVTFSRVVILNDPATFILAKEECGLQRRLSDRSIK
jgi:hypothetical protein